MRHWPCGPADMKLLIFINSNKGRTVLRLQMENRSVINGHLNTMFGHGEEMFFPKGHFFI